MPRYDCREGRRRIEGAVPFPRFDGRGGVLYDAKGERIDMLLWCDTDSGEVERYEYPFRLGSDRRVVTVRELRPAPLTYLPRDGGAPRGAPPLPDGVLVRYPPGQTNTGTADKPVMVDNAELAKKISEYHQSSRVVLIPMTPAPEGVTWSVFDGGAPRGAPDPDDDDCDTPFVVG